MPSVTIVCYPEILAREMTPPLRSGRSFTAFRKKGLGEGRRLSPNQSFFLSNAKDLFVASSQWCVDFEESTLKCRHLNRRVGSRAHFWQE